MGGWHPTVVEYYILEGAPEVPIPLKGTLRHGICVVLATLDTDILSSCSRTLRPPGTHIPSRSVITLDPTGEHIQDWVRRVFIRLANITSKSSAAAAWISNPASSNNSNENSPLTKNRAGCRLRTCSVTVPRRPYRNDSTFKRLSTSTSTSYLRTIPRGMGTFGVLSHLHIIRCGVTEASKRLASDRPDYRAEHCIQACRLALQPGRIRSHCKR